MKNKSTSNLVVKHREQIIKDWIENYQKRWLKLAQELKKEVLHPEDFEYILEEWSLETRGLASQVFLTSDTDLQLKFLFYEFETRTCLSTYGLVAVSHWRDKHHGLLDFLGIKRIKFPLPYGALELGKDIGGHDR